MDQILLFNGKYYLHNLSKAFSNVAINYFLKIIHIVRKLWVPIMVFYWGRIQNLIPQKALRLTFVVLLDVMGTFPK